MELEEKYAWMKVYMTEFLFLWIVTFLLGLFEKTDALIPWGAGAGAVMGGLTLILLFRITYLKGKGSK